MSLGARDNPASIAVVQTVAEKEGVDSADLPPLVERIDTDALDELVNRSREGNSASPIDLTFSYCGYTVRVHDSNEIEVITASKEDEFPKEK